MQNVLDTMRQMAAGDWIDVFFAGVAVWCALWGLGRGLVREAIGLGSVILAFACAGAFYKAAHAGSGIDFGITAPELALMAWYVAIWVGVWLTGKIVAAIVEWWCFTPREGEDKVVLSLGNRMGGLAFGLLKGSAIVGFIGFFLAAIDTSQIPFVGQTTENVMGGSRVVRFARANPQLLGYFRNTDLVREVQVVGADKLVDSLGLPEGLRPGAKKLALPLVSRPELAAHIHRSPTFLKTVAGLEMMDSWRHFATVSSEYQALMATEQPSLKQLLDVVRSDAARQLLADEAVAARLQYVDFESIARELAIQHDGAAPAGDAGSK